MRLNTDYLKQCIGIVQKSYELLQTVSDDTIEYQVYRNSLVKGFEMTIEQSGKLLRKKLAPYFSNKRQLDRLTYKDLFRHALKYDLLNESEVQRWFTYRDNRNETAHDYGQAFATRTLVLVEPFIIDASRLEQCIRHG